MNTVDRIKFIREMHHIQLAGGRSYTYEEVLIRAAYQGNEKALELYNKWKDKLDTNIKSTEYYAKK